MDNSLEILPSPTQAEECAAASLCKLSSELFPKFRGTAAGDWASGCGAAAHAVCGPERGQKRAAFLGNEKILSFGF